MITVLSLHIVIKLYRTSNKKFYVKIMLTCILHRSKSRGITNSSFVLMSSYDSILFNFILTIKKRWVKNVKFIYIEYNQQQWCHHSILNSDWSSFTLEYAIHPSPGVWLIELNLKNGVLMSELHHSCSFMFIPCSNW